MIVRVRGSGVAAACCAHLLTRAGVAVATEATGRPRVPAIMLSESALALLRDVFEAPDLLANRHQITRRSVSWGSGATVLPHPAIAVSEADLVAALPAHDTSEAGPADFTIHAAPLFAAGEIFPSGQPRAFGQRRASAAQVTLLDATDTDHCMVEGVADGWLFLITTAPETSWLLGVGAPLSDLLARSRHIACRVRLDGPITASFDTSPRMLATPHGRGWLACGTPAMTFDPICGDGTAQAIREAILAAAVIVATAEGGDATALQAHYGAMLTAAMRRHLGLSAQFYGGIDHPWWHAQAQALAEGHSWCTARLAVTPEPQFQLDGYRLVPRQMAA